MVKIGIIGGSGLEDPKILEDMQEVEPQETPYGKTSSNLILGKINNTDVVILSRHGKQHTIPPTHVNNRANLYTLKELGCTHIIATTAVGILNQEVKRGDFVILDQFIDFTKHRHITIHNKFEPNSPQHVSLSDPFSEEIRKNIIETCEDLGMSFYPFGTVITIEGPRFSTRAESNLFKQWGADVINMSVAPEATIAKELGLEYAAIAMATDYDCWKTDEPPVTWEAVLEVMEKNSENVKKVLLKTIEKFSPSDLTLQSSHPIHSQQQSTQSSNSDLEFIKSKIRTIPNWPQAGVMFRDVTTLFKDKQGMKKTLEILTNRYKDKQIDKIAGIESRGFILAGALAQNLNAGFVPIRKKGKLPAETESQEYSLEYGTDTVEIHKDAISSGEKVLLVDDLIATGGTAKASCDLIEKLGGDIVECAFVIELDDLGGRQKLEEKRQKVFSIINYEESG